MIAKEFVVPKWVKKEDGATDRYARFVVEPFERGYGTTIGNALRRVLLASLAGSAVTALRIEGIQHEFSAIPGIREDLTTVVLNFKRCQLRLNRDEPIIFSFSFRASPIFSGSDSISFASSASFSGLVFPLASAIAAFSRWERKNRHGQNR